MTEAEAERGLRATEEFARDILAVMAEYKAARREHAGPRAGVNERTANLAFEGADA